MTWKNKITPTITLKYKCCSFDNDVNIKDNFHCYELIRSSSSYEYHGVCVTLSFQHKSERQFLWLRFIILLSRLFQENVSRLSCSTPNLLPSNSFQFCRKQIIYNFTLRNLRNSKSSLYEPRIINDFLIMSLHKRWPIFGFLLVCLHYDATRLCKLFAVKGLMQWIFLDVQLPVIFINCVGIQVSAAK